MLSKQRTRSVLLGASLEMGVIWFFKALSLWHANHCEKSEYAHPASSPTPMNIEENATCIWVAIEAPDDIPETVIFVWSTLYRPETRAQCNGDHAARRPLILYISLCLSFFVSLSRQSPTTGYPSIPQLVLFTRPQLGCNLARPLVLGSEESKFTRSLRSAMRASPSPLA